MQTKQIEDVMVFAENGKLTLYLPSGMNGFELTIFQLRNRKLLQTLKKESNGVSIEETGISIEID